MLVPSFGLFPLIPSIFLIIVIGVIASVITKGFTTWVRNNNMPRVTENARVVAKRTQMYTRAGAPAANSLQTEYYITFEFEDGERLEFNTPSKAFGLVIEGDFGLLTFQGTRFVSFARDKYN